MLSINPTKQHISFCLFKYIGVQNCIGCNVGKSISYLLHGNITQSLHTHWLGTFALVIIVYRIIQIIKTKVKTHGKSVSEI